MTLAEKGALIAGHAPGAIVMMPREEALRLIDGLMTAHDALRLARGYIDWGSIPSAQERVLARIDAALDAREEIAL